MIIGSLRVINSIARAPNASEHKIKPTAASGDKFYRFIYTHSRAKLRCLPLQKFSFFQPLRSSGTPYGYLRIILRRWLSARNWICLDFVNGVACMQMLQEFILAACTTALYWSGGYKIADTCNYVNVMSRQIKFIIWL